MTESAQRKILVTGATGNVGRQVVLQLVEAGVAVRALTRDPAKAGLPDGVEVVKGSQGDAASLEAALDGVDSVFLVWRAMVSDGAPAIVDTIKRHARRIVFLSSGAVQDGVEQQDSPIGQFHADVEQLIEQSGLEWTFLRPHGFATNTLAWAPQFKAGDVVRGGYGTAAFSLIHEADIAAVAVHALTGDGHHGAKYELTGSEPLTQIDQVRLIGEAIGRPVRWQELPPEEAGQYMFPDLPRELVDTILAAYAEMGDNPGPVLSTVEQVTGVPGRSFRQWAQDHAADFR